MAKKFKANEIVIKDPSSFKAVFATTSTEESGRVQSLMMYNTPIGTIAGYDIVWEILTPAEISAILHQMINKKSFAFYCPSAYSGEWETQSFYASNYTAAALTLIEGEERWTDLAINIRRIDAL